MASGVTVEVPLRDLLCDKCRGELQPVEEPMNTGTDLFEARIKLPGEPGEKPVVVPLDAREICYEQVGPNSARVTAILALPCSSCGAAHDVSQQLDASELFVRNLRKCRLRHPQELRDLKIQWRDNTGGGPSAEVSGTLYCPACDSAEPTRETFAFEGASPARARILDVDLGAKAVHVVDAPADAVPLPRALAAEPFAQFPMLRWACSVLKRKAGEKPFQGLRGIFVLHFLMNLIPFAEACLALGLEPEGSVFFFKSKYQYPHRQGVLEWLRGRGLAVRPVEEVREYVDEVQNDLPADARFVIVEDGGYFTPLLHQLGSPLADHVIGAVEQTTKGLHATEDWGRSAGGRQDLDGLMRFPLISIPDSRIKLKVEPPLIALSIVNCIQALDHSLSLPGMRVGLIGLGTIGMEVLKLLRAMGAVVTGFDPDASRVTEARMTGSELGSTAADAARGRKLVIGCSGRRSITADVIANLDHGAWLASGSSDLVEIDREYLEDQAAGSVRLGVGERDWELGRLWAGTRYILSGKPNKEINLMADGFPVTFWGFAGMPHQGGDLIMTVILMAAAELAARNGSHRRADAYSNRIERQAVDELGREYEIEAEYLRKYLPDARA